MGVIMASTVGSVSKKAMSKRKLDALGNIRGQCAFANDPIRLKKLKSQLDLAASLEAISAAQLKAKQLKASKASSHLLEIAEAALAKLKSKGGDISKITKDEICSLALRFFGMKELKGSAKKDDLIAQLRGLLKEQPAALGLSAEVLAVALSRATAAVVADDDDNDDEDDGDHGE